MTPAPLLKAALIGWMIVVANHYHLDPEAFQALCVVESRAAHAPDLSFRVGRLGHSRYWGPGGLNQECFDDPVCYRNPYMNIYFAAKSMRRLIDRHGSWKAALKRYNANCTPAYIREVRRVEKILEGR
jgi:hypothetical protein